MGSSLRVLVVEDSEDDAALVLRELRKGGYDPVSARVDTPEAMKKHLKEQEWDLIISDHNMPHFNSLGALRLLQEAELDVPFIIVSGQIGEEVAVDAMKSGAHDYIMKDRLARLVPSVRRELQEAQVRRARRLAEQALRQQLSRMTLLNQIVRSIGERVDLESVFSVVLQRLEDELPLDMGCILSLTPGKQSFSVAAIGPRSEPLALKLGTPKGTIVLRADVTEILPCLKGEVVYLPIITEMGGALIGKYVSEGIRSVAFVPMMLEEKLFAILTALRRQTDGFSPGEMDFLRALGEHMSLAVQHAELVSFLRGSFKDLQGSQDAVMHQERLRVLGQMASGIAHDINNALFPILGFSELLLDTEKELSEKSKRWLNLVRTASLDISHIVDRLREFYRQRDETEVVLPVDLNKVVQEVIELTRPRWKDMAEKDGFFVHVKLDLEKELCPLSGNEAEIREALINLIFNSVDAMPRGGTITVCTRGTAGASEVILEVTDTGIGMDKTTRERCMEPFYTTKGEQGTGLGLPMVFGVIQRYGAMIQIESEPGEGTTVRLVFPLITEPLPRHAASEQETPRQVGRPLRILYIDDEPSLQGLLKEIIESMGHTAETAAEGMVGIKLFAAAKKAGRPFDVVITDLGMPAANGYEVVRIIKKKSPKTPVILLSGWGSTSLPKSNGAEADRTLTKPLKIEILRQTLLDLTTQPPPGRA